MSLLEVLHPFIYKLQIQEVMCELDIYSVLSKLEKLTHLQLTLSRKKAGMDFDKSMVGIKLADTEAISVVLQSLPNLVIGFCCSFLGSPFRSTSI